MTIIIKLVLFPLTYKSYVSSAKMRVLKPQIDEINAKIPKDKAMERQQATMALYRKAGVNPMGGCIPMLLQFPILIAMYMFFPASIELRQKPFLWANDLSSYDSILDFSFNIPMYGNHISLFTLLMAISMIFSTKISSNQMQGANAQMPGMKMMMYLMPVMMLLWFNNYSSGLSYYYFLTNIITIGQTLVIRRFVDDDAVLRKLNENKKKPVKKSNFQQRLEEMAKQKTKQNPKRK
jgi:YidC/Oxa1 family membrane protein insertase